MILKVQALALGSLSAFFYYTYVGMQIPVGILIDRFSLRWLLTSMILVCAFGCVIFALTSRLPVAAFARLMMGFGAAFAFVSALKIASVWFPAKQFGLLAEFNASGRNVRCCTWTNAHGFFSSACGLAFYFIIHCGHYGRAGGGYCAGRT